MCIVMPVVVAVVLVGSANCLVFGELINIVGDERVAEWNKSGSGGLVRVHRCVRCLIINVER